MSESDTSSSFGDPVLDYTSDSNESQFFSGVPEFAVMSPEEDAMQFEVQIVVRPMTNASGSEQAGSNITVKTKSPSRATARSRASSCSRTPSRSWQPKPPPLLVRRDSSKQLCIQGTAIKSPTLTTPGIKNSLTPAWPQADETLRTKSPVAQGRRRSDSFITHNEMRRVRAKEATTAVGKYVQQPPPKFDCSRLSKPPLFELVHSEKKYSIRDTSEVSLAETREQATQIESLGPQATQIESLGPQAGRK
ncbi:Hypothetical predicted protein [Cloeon dipterum]|uniref:Uncharacterized protein n=1 Tax=Cloeon dipterum TaxID=197152 RepID=A0A8S1DMU4_9INSE|nr:Hypothetical predicted protein [Cloeon dipterum]